MYIVWNGANCSAIQRCAESSQTSDVMGVMRMRLDFDFKLGGNESVELDWRETWKNVAHLTTI
jgi:hypothetical protein